MDQKTLPSEGSVTGSVALTKPKGKWRHRIVGAGTQFLAMFVYLWAILGLLMLHEWVVLARYNIPFTRWGFGAVTALVMAKVMLVLEDFNIVHGFKNKPLIYSIVYKSVVFAAVFIAFYIAEETVGGMLEGKTVLASIPRIGGGTPQGILVVGLIVTLALFPYFAFREIGRALGEEKLRALLFTRAPEPGTSDAPARLARRH